MLHNNYHRGNVFCRRTRARHIRSCIVLEKKIPLCTSIIYVWAGGEQVKFIVCISNAVTIYIYEIEAYVQKTQSEHHLHSPLEQTRDA